MTEAHGIDLTDPVLHDTPQEQLEAVLGPRQACLDARTRRGQRLETCRERVERRILARRHRDAGRRDASDGLVSKTTAALDLAAPPASCTDAAAARLLRLPLFHDVAYATFDTAPGDLLTQLIRTGLCESMEAAVARLQRALDAEDAHLDRLNGLMQQAIDELSAAWGAHEDAPASPTFTASSDELEDCRIDD